MDGEKVKPAGFSTFPACPNCGCTERFFEKLGGELKKRGLIEPEHQLSYDFQQGVTPPHLIDRVPIGGVVPGFKVSTDICVGCGTVYAVLLARQDFKRGLTLINN